MNIITRNNQKTLIFLKKEGDFALASVILLSYEENGKVIRKHAGTQKITAVQLAKLYAEKAELQTKDVYIIDVEAEKTTATVFLDGISQIFDLENGPLIPSPYFQTIVNTVSFFSTQKTRGPNLN